MLKDEGFRFRVSVSGPSRALRSPWVTLRPDPCESESGGRERVRVSVRVGVRMRVSVRVRVRVRVRERVRMRVSVRVRVSVCVRE